MESSTINKVRTNLLVISLAASFVEIAILLSIFLFGVPEDIFLSSAFRLTALSVVACIVLAVHVLARAAFRAALQSGEVMVWGDKRGAVSLSAKCPWPLFVALHLRLSSRRFMFQSEVRHRGSHALVK